MFLDGYLNSSSVVGLRSADDLSPETQHIYLSLRLSLRYIVEEWHCCSVFMFTQLNPTKQPSPRAIKQ
jgi:hypothetical protein